LLAGGLDVNGMVFHLLYAVRLGRRRKKKKLKDEAIRNKKREGGGEEEAEKKLGDCVSQRL
jgi:hypothetical protein